MSDGKQARVVVLHMHLFKNAGTTLDWSLERAFGHYFCDHRDDGQMRGNPQYLARFIQQHPAIEALSSHWLPLPLPEFGGTRFHPVAFVRDPIERIASVYAFERRQAVEHAGTRMARESSLDAYVSWRLEEGTGPVIRNYQMRMLSGEHPGRGDESQLEEALRTVRAFPVVGVVEHYARSIVLLEEALRPQFPDIDLAYKRQNVRDPGDPRSALERREAVEQALGSMRAAAIAANSLDQTLYEHTLARFEQQWDALANAADLLDDLNRRCDQLAAH